MGVNHTLRSVRVRRRLPDAMPAPEGYDHRPQTSRSYRCGPCSNALSTPEITIPSRTSGHPSNQGMYPCWFGAVRSTNGDKRRRTVPRSRQYARLASPGQIRGESVIRRSGATPAR